VFILKTFALFVVTAIAEIIGCVLPYLWLRKNGSPPLTRWDLAGAAVTIAGMGVIVWGGWRV
jgi:small multidrug resistance family-3 protein